MGNVSLIVMLFGTFGSLWELQYGNMSSDKNCLSNFKPSPKIAQSRTTLRNSLLICSKSWTNTFDCSEAHFPLLNMLQSFSVTQNGHSLEREKESTRRNRLGAQRQCGCNLKLPKVLTSIAIMSLSICLFQKNLSSTCFHHLVISVTGFPVPSSISNIFSISYCLCKVLVMSKVRE